MITTPQEYAESVNEQGKAWLTEFYDYMHRRHPGIEPVMFRQRPMFKVGKSYVMFTANKDYFSVHTLNFDLIEWFRQQVPGSGNGKGCVNIRYSKQEAKPLIRELCDEVIRLNTLENPPPVDVTPELPYEQHMLKVFIRGKAKWQPLYEQLRNAMKERQPDFYEHFPAVGIIWKHRTTFATLNFKNTAMRIEFFSNSLHEERKPVRHLQTSANRVAHVVEATDASDFENILEWLEESYHLTSKKK